MINIPELTDADLAFGSIKHMPKYSEVPDRFKNDYDPVVILIREWFYKGLDVSKIKPRNGVDQNKALKAIHAIMQSWEPKHEHKMAGCAMLLDQWFEVK
jgi:hypothetical protein